MATIIIADDDPIVLEVAHEMLRSTGHTVLRAEDGKAALDMLGSADVDLLVTDMLMPAMDGVEVIMTLRARHPAVKVLAISSGGSLGAPYLLTMAKTLGADAVLVKPLTKSVFISAVARLLEEPPAGAQQVPPLLSAAG